MFYSYLIITLGLFSSFTSNENSQDIAAYSEKDKTNYAKLYLLCHFFTIPSLDYILVTLQTNQITLSFKLNRINYSAYKRVAGYHCKSSRAR